MTEPGETGVAAGARLPEGLYFVNTFDYGHRDGVDEFSAVNIPVVAWSTPWTLLGARVQFLVATPAVEVGVPHTDFDVGLYNPLLSGQLAWDLGNGWRFSHLLGAYIGVHTPVAFDSTSINQRFSASYTGNGCNLTADLVYGIQLDAVTNTMNPDFLNLDLTATKKFGKWEIGPVAFGSTDLTSPIVGYQSKGSSPWLDSSATTSVLSRSRRMSRRMWPRKTTVARIRVAGSAYHSSLGGSGSRAGRR